VAVHPSGGRLYVSNNGSSNVTVFTLDSSGNITGSATTVATGGSFSVGVAVR
jgi:DNA-binding beta-propeller fold protein YncE